MRLKGTMTEQEFRDTIIKSHVLLFESNQYTRLMQVLNNCFPEMKTAYFIKHIPEQGEDIYTLLVDIDTIVKVEISHCANDEILPVEISNVSKYKEGLSKVNQIYLNVAIDLAKKDITSQSVT